jgi:hypothetical protein
MEDRTIKTVNVPEVRKHMRKLAQKISASVDVAK